MKREIKVAMTLFGIFGFAIISIILLIQIFQFIIVIKVYNYVVQNIINLTGMSPWLVKGCVILLLIPFVWALLEATKILPRIKRTLLRKKGRSFRKTGILIIIFYIISFFFIMFFLSRDTYFGYKEGEVMKYYAETPEGIRIFDSPGYDPKYGIELTPVTPEMIEQIELRAREMEQKKFDTSGKIEFFNSITGEPKVWYFIDSDKNYEFFDRKGFHPVYWEKLRPVTPDVVSEYKRRLKQIEEEGDKKRLIEDEKNRLIQIEIEREEEIRRQQVILNEKKAYIENYINPIISNDPSGIEIAVLIAEKETMSLSQSSMLLGNKMRDRMKDENTRIVSDLFKDKFIEDGNFEDLYNGDSRDLLKLNLNTHVDYIILGIKESEFFQDERLGELISCNLYLNLKIILSTTGDIISDSYNERGVGIDIDKAELQAIDRIIKKAESFILNKIESLKYYSLIDSF